MKQNNYQDVLDFWFEGEPLGELQMSRWWKKDLEQDELIADKFGYLVERIYSGECDKWLQTAEGRLAAIICLDQFPRNIFRGSGQSFAYDEKALELSLAGVAAGHLEQLDNLRQPFFIMPMMHSEKSSVQEQCVELFEKLVADSDSIFQKSLKNNLDFAIRHRDIVLRYGRFPHRNELLQRRSSPEELAFLSRPGSSF
ncbi:DUF924 domain-containing protein [Endozoicomonas sp. OPT23]|uniref:DUF924 family protein n=1 Tax=Endozoicomonas sp. OPT23 TaxID=2072845 RepID=UPI00129B0252|nr:DUF924 family protein [Endozoicomonas sp. OPT23]MRI34989.1 DUF924 domain-containing protein [Endozoicomonas sp. OPT23]